MFVLDSTAVAQSLAHRKYSRARFLPPLVGHRDHALPPAKAKSSVHFLNEYIRCLALCTMLGTQGAKADTMFFLVNLIAGGLERH